MAENQSTDAASPLPSWGAEVRTRLGNIQYYGSDPHDDSFVVDRPMFVVNLCYDETDIAVNSDRTFRMRTPRDCIVIVPVGSEVREISYGKSEAVLLDIAPEHYSRLLESCAGSENMPLRFQYETVDPEVGNLARTFRTMMLSNNNDAGLVESVVCDLQQAIVARTYNRKFAIENDRSRISPAVVKRVHEFMDAHLDRLVSIETLASLANLSTYHFARAYKNTTGQSPYRANLERRLKHARHLLADPTLTLVDVALRTGFSSQSHLTSAFGHELGLTPGQYRRFNS